MEQGRLKYYVTSYALNPEDLYIGFPTEKLFKGRVYANQKYCSNGELYARVFFYFFKLVILDIIENNITFAFPTGTRAFLEMQNITGEEFVKAYQNGAFQDINYLETNFKGNLIYLRYSTRYSTWRKRIMVCNWMKQMITDNTNAGKQYG